MWNWRVLSTVGRWNNVEEEWQFTVRIGTAYGEPSATLAVNVSAGDYAVTVVSTVEDRPVWATRNLMWEFIRMAREQCSDMARRAEQAATDVMDSFTTDDPIWEVCENTGIPVHECGCIESCDPDKWDQDR